jgi:hypothetical protein
VPEHVDDRAVPLAILLPPIFTGGTMTTRDALRQLEELATIGALYREADADSAEHARAGQRLRELGEAHARQVSESEAFATASDLDPVFAWRRRTTDPDWG